MSTSRINRAEDSFADYYEQLQTYLRKQEQRKILKARRVERKRIAQAGGGKEIAALFLKPIRTKRGKR